MNSSLDQQDRIFIEEYNVDLKGNKVTDIDEAAVICNMINIEHIKNKHNIV